MMRKLRTILFAAVIVVSLAIVAVVVVMPVTLGYQRYVITGGSMTGTIPKGSLIFSKNVPVKTLKVGDIITYYPPSSHTAITHRIISTTRDAKNNRVFQTKGDFNKAADPWKFTLDRPVQAVYHFYIPYLGYVLLALTLPISRILILALPALVIALSIMRVLWREAGDEVRNQKTLERAQRRASLAAAAGPSLAEELAATGFIIKPGSWGEES
jgi:signal peptidase